MIREKLPIKTKIVLGISNWANNLLILLNTYFLLYFIQMLWEYRRYCSNHNADCQSLGCGERSDDGNHCR